ncbi:hypothetical protein [Coralloluteibacterium stylophorae]|uniref:histidine kinase n=1 Tax=Coralloluteibacterium stylophorae TaxID=1776034 RepID=A0A8J7VTP6_9GAMM|nr:hypothetical protein [Coralloluteibacterium stylophorae]MBS7456283.1 hypothetical protein [Coralloluteibacterium stylophorae]
MRQEIEPHLADGTLDSSGPEVLLAPAAALAFGMILHELATNAIKYGALSRSGGRITVAWEVVVADAAPRLHLTWSEHGGPAPVPPQHNGFGNDMIERTLRYQLAGSVRYGHPSEGLRVEIEVPFEDCISVRAAGVPA